jgi:hypothetical protein
MIEILREEKSRKEFFFLQKLFILNMFTCVWVGVGKHVENKFK